MKTEIKVAQFAGYVSEHSCYHHGEMSLNKAIVNQAQEFVGSNNINPLLPNGQFGTRLEGGKDSASERYIFTMLNPITRYIFPKQDEYILNYLDDDGTRVEPDWYTPIIPMILVNGGKGIGTGFSYEGLCYNPSEIISYLKYSIKKPEKTNKIKINPYYEGFKGQIIKIESDKFLFKGCYEVISHDTIKITELPVGTWTSDYKAFLETLIEDKTKSGKKKEPIVKTYIDSCTDTIVEFTIKLHLGKLADLISKNVSKHINGLEKVFKLTTTKKTSNMYLFNKEQQLRKYDTIYDIINEFIGIRLDAYQRRKAYIIDMLEKELVLISNKARFIKEIVMMLLTLERKKKDVIVNLLKTRGYDFIEGDDEYKYLRKMPMDSVCEENFEALLKEKGDKETQLNKVKGTTIQMMWLHELRVLEKEYEQYKIDRANRSKGITTKKKKKKKVKKSKA